ncbi:MAG: hypothetical protein F4Y99_08045 [Acidimicrobiaceae bacterium]|nr:hypothetical protein [Acidimicrobiaceae bacterium]MXZ95861.1 hypothetical protein [Acidimicrobiaceae bacterium]MYF41978.1 hypothetical protein [Acidimicrobiaceae bacterium]MYJ35690.1 hypothetical protein [Acidimicrobiaceae bacterium]
MSLSAELCLGTVGAISARLELEETESVTLTSAMDGSTVGVHRVMARDGVAALVYVAMTVEAFGLDSHMCFAFTPPDSAVPHFTVDSVLAGPHYAFHLDLMPRVDPGANLAYIDHCFVPLSEAHSQAGEIDGLTPAHLSRRQWQLMSAWMLAHRADEDGFRAVFDTVAAYRDHWLDLVVDGVPDGVVDGATAEQLADRDARHRDALFNLDVDPVWAQVDRLLGPDVSARIRDSLQTAGR